jgi:hypothetical protein
MNMFVGATALTVGSKAAATIESDDSTLLALEDQIFEKYEAATAYNDEIYRLWEIWTEESRRLHIEALTGRSTLTSKEQWALVREMPESKEHSRLVELQEPHFTEMDKLVKQMWATPAHTPDGRRAKVLVLLGCVLDDDWRYADYGTDYPIQMARNLLIEFVGGEPAEQLHDQFRSETTTA